MKLTCGSTNIHQGAGLLDVKGAKQRPPRGMGLHPAPMKLTCASTVSTTLSPSTKNSLLMPSSRLRPARRSRAYRIVTHKHANIRR
jgi:hypothetical protein